MATITVEQVLQALSTVNDPELHKDLVSLGMIENVTVSDTSISFTVMLTTPACPLKAVIQGDCESAIRKLVPDAGDIDIAFDSRVTEDHRIREKLDLPIRNIIAVSSGKGGVGKTTVSVNLAISLALEGAKTGILDADIYGPNVPMMFGLNELPSPTNGKLTPAVAHDVHVMSMGFLISPDDALVWRGPMLHGAISQLFTEVAWPELDYLVVDLPPGTGDAQLSLAQLVPLTGGVIVTSPQNVAVSDARRGADAFARLDVPILGIIENMSGEIFGSGGGETIAKELGTEFLGRIELDPRIARGGDHGEPAVIAHADSDAAVSFRTIARAMAARLSVMSIST